METTELAAPKSNGRMTEVGSSGLEAHYGYVEKADHAKLYWPTCYPLFNRLRRRDPQVAQHNTAASAFGSKIDYYWELTEENPDDASKRFVDFLHTTWDDIPGGQRDLIDTIIAYKLMGFMVFENVPGRRDGKRHGDWTSVHDDGLIGLQKIAWRDHSSFARWGMDDSTGTITGFVQQDYPNPEVTIPIDRMTRLKFGDPTSPEGLTPFEALWRLENYLYNLELVFGNGAEHSAGHWKVESERKLTAEDHAYIKRAARAIMSATEGNHVILPSGIKGDIIDVPFSAGGTILEAIKHYGHLKSQVLNIQWMSLSLTGNAGSNASMQTSAGMWLTSFNAEMSGAARQAGEQIATQLRRYNPGAFGSVKRLPVLKATPIEGEIALSELSQFMQGAGMWMDIKPEDIAAARRKSGFLPEVEITEIEDTEEDEQVEEKEDETAVSDSEGKGEDSDGEAEFAHPVAIGDEQITVTDADDLVDLDDPDEIKRISRSLERWSKKNGMNLDLFFNAEAIESDDA